MRHWDLYRLSELPEELENQPERDIIRFIEWADKFPEFLASLDWVVKISLCDEANFRELEIFGPTKALAKLV